MSAELWGSFLERFGLSWVTPESMRLMLGSWYRWKTGHLSSRGKILWDSIPHIVVWLLWREHKNRIFEGKEVSSKRLKDRALGLLYRWTSHLTEFSGCNFVYWIFDWPSLLFR